MRLLLLGTMAATLAVAGSIAGCASAPKTTPPAPDTTPVPRPPSPVDIAAIPDAVPRFEPRSTRGNPPFYEVFGKRYFVLPTAEGYVEQGVASWYGPGFHAASTSNGEPYDMYAMTAAHKTLPLPSYVRVTNLANGRTVVLRVNDRGPFVGNRIIDLSYTAAAKLDMLRAGTALVEVRALLPDKLEPVPPAAPARTLYVQAGAFADEGNAQRLAARLRAAGVGEIGISPSLRTERRLWRVRVGPVESVAEFDRVAAQLAKLGIPDARLASE